MANIPETKSTARLATLDQLKQTILPNFLAPLPGDETLRDWLDKGKVPRFKANPTAKRGGGPVFYSVAGVEKYFRSRILTGREA
jgi:hypothetical protein